MNPVKSSPQVFTPERLMFYASSGLLHNEIKEAEDPDLL